MSAAGLHADARDKGGPRESPLPVAAPSNWSDLVNQEKCGQEMWPSLAITQYRKSKTLRHDRHRTYFSEDALHELNCYRTSFHWR